MHIIVEYLEQIDPDTAYLAIPTRPPLLKSVIPPGEKKINTCYHILNRKGMSLPVPEILISQKKLVETKYENNKFYIRKFIAN